MADLSIGALTKSLEELSIRKQLPLRPKAHKPMLKYDASGNKPVQLFNHSDIVTLREKGPYGSLSQHASHPTSVQSLSQPCSPTKSPRHFKSVSGSSSPERSHGNPYARPLSAKDVAINLNQQKQVKKSLSVAQMSSSSGSSIGSTSSSTATGSSGDVPIQMNSFLRPRSAVNLERRSQKEVTLESNSSKIVNSHSYSQVEKSKLVKAMLSPVKRVIPVKPPTGRSSSLPRPGSDVKKPCESPSKIRNLNYTPSKPYIEVASPCMGEFEPLDRPPFPPRGQEFLDGNVSSSTPYDKESRLTVGTKATRTVFYKKSSKSETLIHEHRPKAEGAVAPKVPSSEKTADVSDDGETDGGEESIASIPSGERLPGDGEASYEDLDDDDGIDNLDDDIADGSGDESDTFSFTSSATRRSSSSSAMRSGRVSISSQRSVSSAKTERPKTTVTRPLTSGGLTFPALTKSLFPHIPPTVNFVGEGEKVVQLPWDIRKLLKWRLSPITPNVVKSTLARIGFRITRKNYDWLGCWGKHMKALGFKGIREYQKLNHFPGSFHIGRKDRLWRNLSKMQLHFGKKEFGFFPQTYVLPIDLKLLKRAWEDGGNKQKWIIKPPASARGIGIKVIHKWTQIPRKKPVIVQKYLARPFLINDSKFDLRIYVYVSCYDPLRIYVYEDGLTRFASMKYSSAMKNLHNKYMHLTNYSINKKNSDYQANSDDKIAQGHKWTLKALWLQLKRQGINTTAIWDNLKDIIIKTIISSEAPVNSMVKANARSRYCVHELFGFDVLLDENLKPWILEVNISPSLHSNSVLDINVKGPMIKDLFNIAGFQIPDKSEVVGSFAGTPDFSAYIPPNDYCMDKRLYTQQLASDERAKHAYYCQRHHDRHILPTVLDVLTPDDTRILTSSIDEDNRKGGFQRVFPTPTTHKYLRLFEQPRYYNLLLDQWIHRYNKLEYRGIALLQDICKGKTHLENPTLSAAYQWNPPSATISTYRDHRTASAQLPRNSNSGTHTKQSASASQVSKINRASKIKAFNQSSSWPGLTPTPQSSNLSKTTATTNR